jgi:UDP-glucose 4-epimerase
MQGTRPSTKRTRKGQRVVAVTGAFGYLGRRLLAVLEEHPHVDKVVAIDIRTAHSLAPTGDDWPLLFQHPKLSVHCLDLTGEHVATDVAEVFQRERVSTLFHLAVLSNPTHALEAAHELESIGTMHVLHAAAAADLGQVVGVSSTMCYGASHKNPAYIRETQALSPPNARSLRDKADVDRQLLAANTPSCAVAVARLAPLLPSAPDHFWTRTFSRRLIPAVPGYDPLMQLLHPDDAVRALVRLWECVARGAFHVVGQGVLPLSHIIAERRALPAYLPSGAGASLLKALWSAQLIDMPPSYLPFFQWPFVCDDNHMRHTTQFVADHDIRSMLRTLQA